MQTYLFQNKKSVTELSSSGGAFSAIAELFFDKEKNASGFGAAFDDDLNVRHEVAESFAECDKFRTSKYCFSEFMHSIPHVEEKLRGGLAVLYSGTPCQIGVLNGYLKKHNVDTTRLLTIDIICHGSPDSKWWKDYRVWLEKLIGSKLTTFSFRWKKARWKGYSLRATFENGRELINTHELQVYMDFYFTNLMMRKSCYSCHFASMERVSDITLGDFWGIDSVMPGVVSYEQIGQGLSLIMSNTKKGELLMKLLKNKAVKEDLLLLECKDDSFSKHQLALNHNMEMPKNHDQVMKEYSSNGLEWVFKKYAGFNRKGKLRFIIKKIANVTGLIRMMKY